MSINIHEKQDVSYLFPSLGSGAASVAGSNWLSDYNAIKNGSYGKLMKAYYGTDKNTAPSVSSSRSSTKNILKKLEEEKKNPRVSKDVQTANSNLTSGLSSLKGSLSTLQNSATYTETEDGKNVSDKVVSAVKSFVSDYNKVVSASKGSTLSGKTAYVANMMSNTAANSDKLSEIGVRVNSNGTLELDETRLKTADVSKVQDLFSSENIMSYGSRLASRVQFAGNTVTQNTVSKDKTDSAAADKKTATGAIGLKEDGTALASKELYQKTKDKDGVEKYDIDKIFSTAKSFVNNYNRMFETAESSSNSGVLANLSSISQKTADNAEALKGFGINVGAKGRLTIDEETFRNADMSKVQQFFKNYGASVSTNASLVNYYMTTQAGAGSGYTAAGAYNVQGGSNYNGIM